MLNRFEYRLHQIEILLRTYREADEEYPDEIQELELEREEILKEVVDEVRTDGNI